MTWRLVFAVWLMCVGVLLSTAARIATGVIW